MKREELLSEITDAIRNLKTDEIVYLHNRLCEETTGYDDFVEDMDEFDEVCEHMKPWEIARAAFYGDFRPCDDFFRFDAYGNLVSFDYWDDDNSPIDVDAIAEYVVEHNARSRNAEAITACMNALGWDAMDYCQMD